MKELLDKIEQLDEVGLERFILLLKEAQNERPKRKQLVSLVASDSQFSEHEIKDSLSNNLPEYMVPAQIVEVEEIPRLHNGKPDLRTAHQLIPSTISATPKDAANEIEKKLQSIWSDVLGFEGVGIDDNFFEIGGDSILSIQIIAQARKKGIELKPTDIFENQTIAELATVVEKPAAFDSGDTSPGPVPLLPIQRWFFDSQTVNTSHWNQGIVLGLEDEVSVKSVREALRRLCNSHDALRIRFSQKEGDWQAELAEESAYAFAETTDPSDFPDSVIRVMSEFSLHDGPLFGATLLNSETERKLALVAHHLVVDPLSWEILADDLSGLLNGESVDGSSYASALRDLSRSIDKDPLERSLNYWKSQRSESTGVGEMPVIRLPITESEVRRDSFAIEIETNASTQETESRVIAAVVDTVVDLWNREDVLVGVERQLRSAKSIDVNLSSVVGWLTSYFPLRLEKQETTREMVRHVEKTLARVSDVGLEYGLLRYELGESELSVNPEILINYLGTETVSNFEVLESGLRSSVSNREYLLEINCSKDDDNLRFSITSPIVWDEVGFRTLFENGVRDFFSNEIDSSGVDKAGLSSGDFASLMDQID